MNKHYYRVDYKYSGVLDWNIVSEHGTLIKAEKWVAREFKRGARCIKHRIVKVTTTNEVVYESN